MMNIEIKIVAGSVEELQEALAKLGSPVMTKVNITTDAPAIVQGGELAIPAGADLTVAGVTRDSVKITSDLTQEPMPMPEPEKPKAKRAPKKAQEPAVEPEAPQAATTPAEPEKPAESAVGAPETQMEVVADHPAAADIAAEAAGIPTLDEIAAAGAALLDADAGKMMPLLDLLGQFGVQAITQLKPEQLGDFAAAMRGLGAEV